MTTLHDDDIRALLEPLRGDAPPRAAVNTAVMRAGRPTDRRRPVLRRGPLAAAVAAGAGALAVLALWPAAQPSRVPGSRSVAGAFLLASANAADRVDGGAYRFTRIRVTLEGPGVDLRGCPPPPPAVPGAPAHGDGATGACARPLGRTSRTFTTSQWVDGALHGRVVATPLQETGADGAVTTLGEARDERFRFGDALLAGADGNAVADLGALPADAAQLESRLAELGLHGYDPAVAGRARDYVVVQSAIALLVYPKVSPALRAAAFGVLARIDGFRDLGEGPDPLGRRGRHVALTVAASGPGDRAPHSTIAVWFDPARAELLSWTERAARPGGDDVRTSVIERAADVPDTGARP